MTIAPVSRPRVHALALAAMFMPLVSGLAALPEEMDFEALQADARRSFKDEAAPFLEAYCTKCHGSKKMKSGINFAPAIKNPGSMAFSRQWKQALGSVKSHDMPPDDVDKQPTDEERQKFVDWIARIKFLSPKEPGPFLIPSLTQAEYS